MYFRSSSASSASSAVGCISLSCCVTENRSEVTAILPTALFSLTGLVDSEHAAAIEHRLKTVLDSL